MVRNKLIQIFIKHNLILKLGVISGNYDFDNFLADTFIDQKFVIKVKANISNLKFLSKMNVRLFEISKIWY